MVLLWYGYWLPSSKYHTTLCLKSGNEAIIVLLSTLLTDDVN